MNNCAVQEKDCSETPITNPAYKSFCRQLGRRVREYFATPEHRKEFEDWYLQEHGKPYKWKTWKDVFG